MNMNGLTGGSMVHPVHIGIWTNWSRGPVLGATLTVDQQTGGLLIAILAFFITWIGTSFWRICCFIFHQAHSTSKPRDGLYHQRQAILRNAATAESGLSNLLETGWAWRRNSRLSICRTLPLAFFAALCVASFAFASAFSSKISTAVGNEVLLSSPDCGYTAAIFNDPETLAAQTFEPFLSQSAISYANYAQECYYTNTSTILECTQFIKRNLPGMTQTNAACPFGGDICHSDSGNLILDTGLLDSHYDFGLNAPPDQRFKYRRRVQCAPIKTEGYSDPYTAMSGRKYVRYNYGHRIPQHDGQDDGYTYAYRNDSLAELLETNMTSAQADYTLSGVHSASIDSSIATSKSTFVPIPQLHIPNADISVFFLSGNQILYTAPTNDSWYRGDRAVRQAASLLPPNPLAPGPYFSDEAASPLACAVQVQYCASSRSGVEHCSQLGSAADSLSNITSQLQESTEHQQQLRRFQWFVASTVDRALDIPTAVSRLGVHLLTARYRLQNGVQGLLPADQWQMDVMHWHATTMAHLQGTFVDTATGPPSSVLLPWLVKPSDPVEEEMCRSQKILSTTHTSFALFPLLLILSLGVLIILTSILLAPLCTVYSHRRLAHAYKEALTASPHSRSPSTSPSAPSTHPSTTPGAPPPTIPIDPTTYARHEWVTHSTPHLIRHAHEPLGLGTWTRASRSVPVTRPGEALAVLDLPSGGDPRHPRLKAPPANFMSIISGTTATTAAEGNEADDGDDDEKRAASRGRASSKFPSAIIQFREMANATANNRGSSVSTIGLASSTTTRGSDDRRREDGRDDEDDDAATTRTSVLRDEVLLSPLPDYDNWPLPPSGQLTPTLTRGESEQQGAGRSTSSGHLLERPGTAGGESERAKELPEVRRKKPGSAVGGGAGQF